jgi:hypothetical protein
MYRRAAVSIAVVLMAGCGGGDDAGSSTDATFSSSPADTTADAVPAGTTPAVESTSMPTVAAGVIPGTATITLLTSGSGLGARPILQWDPVDRAVEYVVSVNAPSGGPLWTWNGSSTMVPFGGGPADDPDTTGAQLTGPATWFVAAIDDQGRVIATSATAELGP